VEKADVLGHLIRRLGELARGAATEEEERGRPARLRAALRLLTGAAYLVFIGAALGAFAVDTIDALARKDTARLCKNIALYATGLVTAAALEKMLKDD
jgi:hypothetical protein